MSQREVSIVGGPYGTKAKVTGQEELVVTLSSGGTVVPVGGAPKTPNFIRATGSSSIASACTSVSVANVGAANGTFLGTTIKTGETLSFDAGAIGNYFAAGSITYNGTGTELLIIYIV
jgi:hypothetical protein